ncbi:hypothetical protein BDF20DRAFT_836977 [Mycotypha africana]|uniref:uncharacterized protein n=1 Tax=Mycotypha africana TaxID=64632 RepID=UPI0023017088|nr:uncharacterized protein BDF20DRAFT_836977 [Mycotypha africana]KAI8975600.1 hypothetical protein BDF20DRAFT_836977 [Mycotypha africana]
MSMLRVTTCFSYSPVKAILHTRSSLPCIKPISAIVLANGWKVVNNNKRYHYTTQVDNLNNKNADEEPVTIYTGPLANVAKKLKLFSITSLGLGVGASPFIFAVDVPVPFVAKAALVGAAIATSAASTGLIQWVMSPYVTKITVSSNELSATEDTLPKKLNVHTLSFTAKEIITTVPVAAIQPATRIFTSWMINDPSAATARIGDKIVKPRTLLYVHPEVCEDEEAGVIKNVVNKTGIGKGF